MRLESAFLQRGLVHAESMKTRLLAFLSSVSCAAIASAETYRSVPLSKLKIEGPKEEIADALDRQINPYELRGLGVRMEGECYPAMDESAEDQPKQESVNILFKGDAKLPLKGVIDLNLDWTGSTAKTYHFSIPEGVAKEVDEKAFLKAREDLAGSRSLQGQAGAPWWNHLSRDDEDDAQRGLQDSPRRS